MSPFYSKLMLTLYEMGSGALILGTRMNYKQHSFSVQIIIFVTLGDGFCLIENYSTGDYRIDAYEETFV